MKVSVIIPVYNAEQYLNQCLDSLLLQTLSDIEFIVINDGSSDRSEAIIQSYQDKRIQYYRHENHGISYTRNFGISKATGEYIAFLDSDDYVSNNCYEIMYQEAKQQDVDIVVCNYININQNKEAQERLPYFSKTSMKHHPEFIFAINSSPWNKLYRRSLIEAHQIVFPLNLKYEDVVFVATALYYANSIAKVEEALVYYRIHLGSETTVMQANVQDIFQVLDRIRSLYTEAVYKESMEFFCIHRLMIYNLQQVYQQQKQDAMVFISDSFQYLNKMNSDWKKNKLFKNDNSWVEYHIKKSKKLTTLYVWLMRKIK